MERKRARPLLGLRCSSALEFCVKLMAVNRRKYGIFYIFTAAAKHRQELAWTHPTESPRCWESSYSHTPACQTCTGAGGETTRDWKHTSTHTHTLQPWREGDPGHTPYLVLLSAGVIFPNPSGPCCPLSEENSLVMPCLGDTYLSTALDLLTLWDPIVYPFHSNLTVIILPYGGFRSFSCSCFYLSRARQA